MNPNENLNNDKEYKVLKILMTRTDLELLIARGIQKGIFDIEIKK